MLAIFEANSGANFLDASPGAPGWIIGGFLSLLSVNKLLDIKIKKKIMTRFKDNFCMFN